MAGRFTLVQVLRDSFPKEDGKRTPAGYTDLTHVKQMGEEGTLCRMTSLYKRPELGTGRRRVSGPQCEGGAERVRSQPLPS